MILAGTSNIREVIAFPFNQNAQDMMMGAPSEVSSYQLKDLHIAKTTINKDVK
jgi:aspartyl-tRNA synthetase